MKLGEKGHLVRCPTWLASQALGAFSERIWEKCWKEREVVGLPVLVFSSATLGTTAGMGLVKTTTD